MLSIAYEDQAIPLFWHMLKFQRKKSASAAVYSAFWCKQDKVFLADRELANGRFFKWLDQKKNTFLYTRKKNSQLQIKRKKLFSTKKAFSDLNPKTGKIFGMAVALFGQRVFLVGSSSERGELMVIATNKNDKTAVSKYLRQWEIECLFQSLKNRGFRFEETHIVDESRIAKLIALLAIGFAWAHKVRKWSAPCKRPQYSLFRYGLEKQYCNK
jgi:hypothetical protein